MKSLLSESLLQVGWNDSFNNFVEEVKNLTARDLSSIGTALKRAFDLLNQYRLQTSIDNYGQVPPPLTLMRPKRTVTGPHSMVS